MSQTSQSRTIQSVENQPNPSADQRPRFGIGHVGLPVDDVTKSADFYQNVGMRLILNMGRAAILELRGGTHLIISEGRISEGNTKAGSLDLIVDDIDETHTVLASAGANPSNIKRGNPHDQFTAIDPSGNLLVVNSNHAMGPV